MDVTTKHFFSPDNTQATSDVVLIPGRSSLGRPWLLRLRRPYALRLCHILWVFQGSQP